MRRGNYAPRACNHCRRRKTKCNGAQPVCSRCSAAGHECTWGPESARKPTSKSYVDSLRNMLEVAKKRIEILEAQLAMSRRAPDLIYRANAVENELLSLEPSEKPSRDANGGLPPVDEDEGEAKQEEDSDIEQLCAPTEHLRLDEEGLQFYGPTSIFRLAPQDSSPQHVSRRFQQLADNQSGSYVLSQGDGYGRPDIDWSRHLPSDISLTRAEHDRILDLCFRFFTSWCLRVVPELFLHDMCRALSTPRNQPPPKTAHYSPMLHNALLSVATAFSDVPEVKNPEARRKYAVKAKDRLEEECERPNLSVILALSILSNFHSSQGEQTLGYMYFGISARMSQALGLGFDCKPWVAKGLISEDNMNDRNWVYWTTFCQDTTWSLYVGRDFCVSSLSDRQRIHVPFVNSQLDHFNWDWPGQNSRPNFIPSTFAATCDLLQIARQILDVVSNFSRLGMRQALDDYLIGQMDLKLHTWKNNLPPDVDVSKLTFGNAMPHQLMLQMTYHWLCIVLHRPFYRKKRSLDERVFEVDHMKLCDKAAHDIMDLATKWRELYSLRYVPITFIQVVSAAGTIFVLSAVQAVSGARLARTAHHNSYANAEKSIRYLYEVGESFQSAKNIGKILDNLLKEQVGSRLERRSGLMHTSLSPQARPGEYPFPRHSPTASAASLSPPEEPLPAPTATGSLSIPDGHNMILNDPFGLMNEQQYFGYGAMPQSGPSTATGYPAGAIPQFDSSMPDLGHQNLLGMDMWMHAGEPIPNVPYMSGSPEQMDFDPDVMDEQLLQIIRQPLYY